MSEVNPVSDLERGYERNSPQNCAGNLPPGSKPIPPITAPAPLKIGDILWYRTIGWCGNQEDQGWCEGTITGETPRSWLVKNTWRESIVSKITLDAKSFDPGRSNQRHQFYTDAQKQEIGAKEEWLNVWGRPLFDALDTIHGVYSRPTVDKIPFYKKLIEFLQAEGFEIKPKEAK